MLVKRAHNSQMVSSDVSSDYIITTAQDIKTGDETVDINSNNKPSLPINVAQLIKNDKVETLFNGHAGLKAKHSNVTAQLDGKNPKEYVFARMRAIDACGFEKKMGSKPPEGNNEDLHGANDNGDFFSVEQLLAEKEHEGKIVKAYETFVGVPFFTNHKNDNIEEARGKIINAFYDLDDHCVYCDVMVDAKSYPKLARGIEQGYMSDCSMGALWSESRVLMADGTWKKHSEINLGDLVLTHTGQIQPITAIARSNEPREYYEVCFIGQDVPINASEEHPFLIIKREELECEYAQKKQKCTSLGAKTNKFCKRHNCDYSRGRKSKEYNLQFVDANKLKIGDYVLTPINKWIDCENNNADLEFAAILGYYLSEGQRKPTTQINFWFHKDETYIHDDCIKNIVGFCERQNYNYRIESKIKDNVCIISVFSKELFNLIGEFSSGTSPTHNKKISNKDVFGWSKNAKLALIGKMINGDGCNVKTKRGNGNALKIYSGSKTLIEQLNDMCLSCGIVSRKSSFLREKYSENSVCSKRGTTPNEEYALSIGNFDADKLSDFTSKYVAKTKTRTRLENKRFIYNGYLCSPITKLTKKQSGISDVFYHIEVGGNENKKINDASDHSYIADGVAVHNCAVEYSTCSICGNKAAKADEYCTHIRNSKGKKFGGTRCYEINHGLKFIELSAVTDGACENCKVDSILQPEDILKVASDLNNKIKTSNKECNCKMRTSKSALINECFDGIKTIHRYAMNNSKIDVEKYSASASEYYSKIIGVVNAAKNGITKTASKEDLQALYDALQKLKEVTIKIIKSEDVDYEFVEDLSGVLADLQNLIVDLAEAGFGDVADSSTGGGENAGAAAGVAPAGGGEVAPEQAAPPPAAGAPAQGGAGAAQGFAPEPENPMTGLASTVRKINILNNKYSSKKGNSGINEELSALNLKRTLESQWNTIMQKESSLMNSVIEVKDGDFALKIAGNKISAYHKGQVAQESEVASLPKALAAAYKENPKEAAEIILRAWRDGILQTAYEKNPPPVQEVQERQLEGLKGNFDWKRKDDYVEELSVIEPRLDEFDITPETGNTEILLDGQVKDTGEDRFTRKETAAEMPVLEARMSDEKRRVNDGEAPAIEVIERRFEKDTSKYTSPRWNDDVRPGDEVPVMEKQFMGESKNQPAGKDRIGLAVMEVQEGQLEHKRQGEDAYDTGSNMSVAEVAIDRLVKSAARSIVECGVTPKSMVGTFASLVNDYKGCFSKWASSYNDKKSAASVIQRLRVKTASKDLSRKQLATMLLDRVVDSYNSKDYDPSILAQAAKTLAGMPTETEKAIKAEVQNALERIKKAASGEQEFVTKEQKAADFFKAALLKKAGSEDESYPVTFTSEDVDGLQPHENGFDDAMHEVVADVLSENGIIATADSISIDKLEKDNDGCFVATATVHQPTTTQAKFAALKQVLTKMAQGMPPAPQGSQFGDPNAGNAAPADPAAAGGAGPGVGALTTPPPDFNPEEGNMDEMGEEGDEAPAAAPKFPGKICPACGAEDVEQVDDHFKCENCDTEFKVNVNVDILNTSKYMDNVDLQGGGEEEMPAEEGGEMGAETNMSPMSAPAAPAGGAPAPAAPAAAPQMPTASGIQTQIVYATHPSNMMVTANTQGYLPHRLEPVAAGHRCPNCSSTRVCFENDKGVCTACGTDYTVKLARKKSSPDMIQVSIDYVASNRTAEHCGECDSAKKKLAKKLASIVSNQQTMIKEANLDTDTELEAAKISVKHRMLDGFSEKSAIVITNGIMASVQKQLKLAQAMPEEENDMDSEAPNGKGNGLVNPLRTNEVTRDIQDDSDNEDIGSFFGDEIGSEETPEAEEVEIEVGEDPEVDEAEDSDIIEDNGEEALDNMPGEGGGKQVTITIDTGSAEPTEVTIDTETGEVEVNNEFGDDYIDVEEEGEDRDQLADEFESDVDETLDSLKNHVDGLSDDIQGEEECEDEECETEPETDESEDEGEADEEGEGKDEGEGLMVESDPEEKEAEAALANAIEMNGNMVLSSGKTAGRYIDIDKVAAAIGMVKTDIKSGGKKLASQPGYVKKETDVKLSRTPNLMAVFAQKTPAQTMPLDVEDDVDAGVPRDESVGLKQTEPKDVKKVKKDSYDRGKGKGQETEVVPRDGSGDGVGGKAVSFEPENADKATSGKPDSYVQTLVEQIKPTPAGNKENHAVAASERDIIEAFAQANGIKDSNEIELADLGPFYIVAHKKDTFKLDKENYTGEPFIGTCTANFENVSVRVTGSSDEVSFEKTAKKELPEALKQHQFKSKGKSNENKPETKEVGGKKKTVNKEEKEVKDGCGMACSAVAKKFNFKVANLEALEFEDSYAVLNKANGKVYEVKKK